MRLIESMEPLWRSLRPSDARRRVEREARAGVHLRGGRACGEVQPGSDDGKRWLRDGAGGLTTDAQEA